MIEMSMSLRQQRPSAPLRMLLGILLLGYIPTVLSYTTNPFFIKNSGTKLRPPRWGPPEKRDSVPLVISNLCPEMIWPGIGTQAGTGAGTGGFALDVGASRSLTVGADWQGRVWGRTNCSFNVGGTGGE